MLSIPISEFRANIPEFIKKLERGVKIALTSHGKIVAELTPPSGKKEEMQKRLDNIRKHSRVGDVVTPSDQWEAQD